MPRAQRQRRPSLRRRRGRLYALSSFRVAFMRWAEGLALDELARQQPLRFDVVAGEDRGQHLHRLGAHVAAREMESTELAVRDDVDGVAEREDRQVAGYCQAAGFGSGGEVDCVV